MEYFIKDKSIKINLLDKIFNYKFNNVLVKQLINTYINNLKQGTKAQKSRSTVKGSNKKPWKQKGTGRARAGSVKSPIWRKGGVTFAAKPFIKKIKINKKMVKGGLRSIFSELIRQNKIVIISNFYIKYPKTSLFIDKINLLLNNNLKYKKISLLDYNLNKNIFLASKNIPYINVYSLKRINLIKLINSNIVIITLTGIKFLEHFLSW